MSYLNPAKENQILDKTEVPINLSSSISSLMNNSNISLSNESPQSPANRRVVKSCFWSTTIFSINFVSSILVINLAKW